MKYNFTAEKTSWNNIDRFLCEYFSELGYKNDGFYNDIIFEGEPYLIKINGENSGFFSLGNAWNEGKMYRAFYIVPSKRRYSIKIFAELMYEYGIVAALVVSNDSHFVSLAFEKMNELNTNFDMQAFNFVYGKPEREAEYGMEYFTKVSPDDYELMNRLCENQWEDSLDSTEFYAIKRDSEILGYGSISNLNYNGKKVVDIGNFTLPQHRRKGVGRSLIINLGKKAIEQGYTPVAGCWYGNKESIATLQSSGFIPENRIFYVRFK